MTSSWKGISCGSNRTISQISQCTKRISHYAPFCNRNVHTCAHFCYKVVNCGIWDWCIVECVRQVHCRLNCEWQGHVTPSRITSQIRSICNIVPKFRPRQLSCYDPFSMFITGCYNIHANFILNWNLVKSRVARTDFSFPNRFFFLNFAQSTTLVLPCAVQNFKTIVLIQRMLWDFARFEFEMTFGGYFML